MMIARRPPVPLIRPSETLTGAADRCCAEGLCDYRPQMVAVYISVIRQLRAAGEDVGEAAESALAQHGETLGRCPGVSPGSGKTRYAMLLWDVERAVGQGAATVEDVCRRLCPWSLEVDVVNRLIVD